MGIGSPDLVQMTREWAEALRRPPLYAKLFLRVKAQALRLQVGEVDYQKSKVS